MNILSFIILVLLLKYVYPQIITNLSVADFFGSVKKHLVIGGLLVCYIILNVVPEMSHCVGLWLLQSNSNVLALTGSEKTRASTEKK